MTVETIISGDTADKRLSNDKERPSDTRRDEGEIEEEKISRTNGETRSNDDGRLSDRYPPFKKKISLITEATWMMRNVEMKISQAMSSRVFPFACPPSLMLFSGK